MTRVLASLALSICIAPMNAACQKSPELAADSTRVVSASLGGKGIAFTIPSSILKQTRKINIALPASYDTSPSSRKYPVFVVLDGEAYLAPVAVVGEELSRHGLIPEAIIVAIENEDPYRGRVHDLTPPGLSVSGSGLNEGGDRFLDFIEQELLPAVDRRFRGAAPRVLIGHSSGGILATYAAATRPAFRLVVAIDAPISLGGNWLAKRMLERTKSDSTPLRFAYYQARFPWPDAEWKTLEASAPASWRVHREVLAREGHETVFMLGAYLGLREVFGEYSRLAAPEAPTTRKLPYYAGVSAALGGTLYPPRRIVRDVVDDFLMEGRGADARKAYAMLLAGYGSPSDSATLLTRIAEVERQPPPAETVESLLATPFPTPAEIAPYVGTWSGPMWMRPSQVNPPVQHLHIAVVDGKVTAQLERPDAPEEIRFKQLEYLRVTPGGLTFGFMNGMRPRGMILHEGKLVGNTLSGKQRWGGITFNLVIPGEEPIDPGFSLKKVSAKD